jgi:uncharacterized protein (TIGR02466 family)
MAKTSHGWIEASEVIPMFPTLVWKIQLRAELRETMDAGILAALARIRRDVPTLTPGQGWQSEKSLHEREEFRELVERIGSAASGILRFLLIGYDRYEITGCWANVLTGGASHKRHTHPNNFLSGVYYLRTHPGADTLNFHDPRPQTAVIRPPVTGLSAENTDQVVVRVANGTLLMFPSWLEHSVDPTRSDDERISISFNIMFSSFAEELAKPMW